MTSNKEKIARIAARMGNWYLFDGSWRSHLDEKIMATENALTKAGAKAVVDNFHCFGVFEWALFNDELGEQPATADFCTAVCNAAYAMLTQEKDKRHESNDPKGAAAL